MVIYLTRKEERHYLKEPENVALRRYQADEASIDYLARRFIVSLGDKGLIIGFIKESRTTILQEFLISCRIVENCKIVDRGISADINVDLERSKSVFLETTSDEYLTPNETPEVTRDANHMKDS